MLQVYNAQNNFLMKNATFDSPQFDFTNLASGAYYNVDVYAYNKKGMSDVFTIRTNTLKEPEKQTGISLKSTNYMALHIIRCAILIVQHL